MKQPNVLDLTAAALQKSLQFHNALSVNGFIWIMFSKHLLVCSSKGGIDTFSYLMRLTINNSGCLLKKKKLCVQFLKYSADNRRNVRAKEHSLWHSSFASLYRLHKDHSIGNMWMDYFNGILDRLPRLYVCSEYLISDCFCKQGTVYCRVC